MKRLLLLLIILSLSLTACGQAEISIEQPTDEPATVEPVIEATLEEIVEEEPTAEMGYNELMELTFDGAADLEWVDIGSPNPVNREVLIKDGNFRMGDGEEINFARFQPDIVPGSIVHLQFKPSSDVCFPIYLRMEKDGDEGENLFMVSGCSSNNLDFKAVRNDPESGSTEGGISMSTATVIQTDVWTDVIYWLHPDGDKLFTFLLQGDQLAYGSVAIPQDWQSDMAHLFVGAWFDTATQYLDINSIRSGEGSLQAYLEEYVPEYQPVKDEVVAFLEAEPQAFPDLGANNGDEMQSEDAFDRLNMWLYDWNVVFGENVDAMKDNQGGQFGPGALKVYSEEENVFTFSEMDGMIWTPLNTHLDEFDGVEPGGNQAIMINFQPSVANALDFTFMGPNEFGVEFWDDGHPSIYYFVEAYKEGFGEGFALEGGLWYNMLMAIDKDGTFLAVVWEDGNYENHAIFKEDLSARDMGDGYKNTSWKFIIGSSGSLTLNVREYNVFSFSGLVD